MKKDKQKVSYYEGPDNNNEYSPGLRIVQNAPHLRFLFNEESIMQKRDPHTKQKDDCIYGNGVA